ncbi:hypothetical protein ACEZDB_25865, partial [Streptacidiphilus sp. N1-3]
VSPGGGGSGGDGRRAWRPLGAGPPPLGPQALAAPGGLGAVPPLAVVLGGGRSAQATRWERDPRLLPLGIGLALIGGGAGLFGWRLRRP